MGGSSPRLARDGKLTGFKGGNQPASLVRCGENRRVRRLRTEHLGAEVSLRYHGPMAFTLRTDDELERALDELSAQEGLSKQEVIRRAVLDRYERAGHRQHVDAAADRAVARWGDVLDRLGSV